MTKDLLIGFFIGIVVGFPVGILLLRETLKFFVRVYSEPLIEKAVAPALHEVATLAAEARIAFSKAGAQINADAAKSFRFLADYANAQSLKGGRLAYLDPPEERVATLKHSDASDDLRFEGKIYPVHAFGLKLSDFMDVEPIADWIAREDAWNIARAYLVNVDDAATSVPRRFPRIEFDFVRGFIAINKQSEDVDFLYVPSGRLQPEAEVLKQIAHSLKTETNYQGRLRVGVPAAEDQPFDDAPDSASKSDFEVVAAEDFPSMNLWCFDNLQRVASYEGKKRLIVSSATFNNSRTEGFRFGSDFAAYLELYIAYEELSGNMAFAFIPIYDGREAEGDVLTGIASFLSKHYKECGVWTVEPDSPSEVPKLPATAVASDALTEAAIDKHCEKFFASVYNFGDIDLPNELDFANLHKAATLDFPHVSYQIFSADYIGGRLDEKGEVALILDGTDRPQAMLKPATMFLYTAVVEYLNLLEGSRGKLTVETEATEKGDYPKPISEGRDK